MNTQEILVRTAIEFTNEITFLDFTRPENVLIKKEEMRINNLISTYNDLVTATEFYIPAKAKKVLKAEIEKLDTDIDFFINNLNIDLKKVTERINAA